MIAYIVIGLIALAFLFIVFLAVRRDKHILSSGIETDAVVSRVSVIHHNEPGERSPSYEYFVSFKTEGGEKIEARLRGER